MGSLATTQAPIRSRVSKVTASGMTEPPGNWTECQVPRGQAKIGLVDHYHYTPKAAKCLPTVAAASP